MTRAKSTLYKAEILDGNFVVTVRTFPARFAGEFGNDRDYPEEREVIRVFDNQQDAQNFADISNGGRK